MHIYFFTVFSCRAWLTVSQNLASVLSSQPWVKIKLTLRKGIDNIQAELLNLGLDVDKSKII